MARRSDFRQLPAGGDAPGRAPRSFPLPNALDPGREWEVVEGLGSVQRSPGAGRMDVPLSQSDRDRWVRLHEMAHVKWTPIAPTGCDGIPFSTVNAVEDCRIHARLSETGMNAGLERVRVLDDADLDRWGKAVEEGRAKPIDTARMVAGCMFTGDERPFLASLDGTGHEWVGGAVRSLANRHMGPRRPAWKRTVEMAHELEALFADLPESIDDPVIRDGMTYLDSEGGSGWGPMEVVEMPLPVGMPRTMSVPRHRATDTGAVPRNWSRLASDGRVFTRKRRRPSGGSILIDQSGSMSLTADDVQTIIETYPGVLVATYAGTESRGELRVIARNGRRASDEDCLHPWGGNTVDGPALDWLAEQPAPRVWVSDGQIVGANGDQSPALYAEVARTTHRARITRVDGIHHLTTEEER